MESPDCQGVDGKLSSETELPTRWHWLTAAWFFIVTAATFFSLNVPGCGDVHVAHARWVPFILTSSHGWPLTFLEYEFPESTSVLPPEIVCPMNVWYVLVDLAAAMGIAGALIVLWRSRRRRCKRLLQFHLADVVGLMLVTSAIAGVYAVNRSIHQSEVEVVQSIGRTGDAVWSKGGPLWLRRWIGDDHARVFDRVVYIGGLISNVEECSKLTSLKSAVLGGRLTTERLAQLQGARELEMLTLHFIPRPVGQAPVEEPERGPSLPRLPRLRQLVVKGPPFRGEGLDGLPSLEVLDAAGTRVDDEGIAGLVSSRLLHHLTLEGCPVSDKGLAVLAELSELRKLNLAHTWITDAGVRQLARLNNLESLSLNNTGITDDCIDALCQLRGLEDLEINITNISRDGYARLHKALPNCHVDHHLWRTWWGHGGVNADNEWSRGR